MAALFRRALLPLFLVVLVTPALGGQVQNPPPAPAPAVPRPIPPDTAAFQAALQIREPAARLAALEKVRADFPQALNAAIIDTQILSLLVANSPDRTQDITAVFDRILGRIADNATPEQRLTLTIAPVNQVVGKKLLLDRSEQLMTAAVAALDFDTYAEAQRGTLARLKQPVPADERLRATFGAIRARGLEVLARIATARGDAAKAESLYTEAVDANATFGPAVTSLVDIYTARQDFDKAEALLQASIKAAATPATVAVSTVVASPPPAAVARPVIALADLYEKKGDDTKLETLLRDTLKTNPTMATVLLRLGRLEARRDNHAKALDHFLTVAAQGSMTAADDAAMREAYRAVHGASDAGLETLVDKMYVEKFPNPVKPEPYTPLPNRSDRLVLLEMFTGSACGPCVAADLAFDAVMEHYPAGTIVPIAYHQHIPGPDPMVTTGSSARREYYQPFRGVPTFNIDGGLGRLGGGARTGAVNTYKDYIAKIDKALQTPATAALAVSATGDGDQIVVTAEVSKLPADAKDLRLHILLVEKHLRFTGENGIRFHPMVVRGSAGENGSGIPITAIGKTLHTFSLNAIRDDITSSLQTEIEKRRKTEAPGSTPREYAAAGRPYVAIDTAELSVVAFIQQGAYQSPVSGPTTAQVTGVETTSDAGAQTTGTAATAPAPAPRPAAAGPLTNVLQAAIAEVVFPSTKLGAGPSTTLRAGGGR